MKILDSKVIEQCVSLIQAADCILIGAGAGMSAAAGIDYTDSVRFSKLFPEMFKRGFRNNYELMGFQGLRETIMWGYHAMHVQHVAYEMQEHAVYQQLLKIIGDKNYFIMTSNVDRMFYKNHFNHEHIYTPQGDYTLMQCLEPCSDDTWDTRPFLDVLLKALDKETHEVKDPSAIPSCPKCGGPMFMNVRGGNWFIEKPYQNQRQQLQEWVKLSMNKKLLVMEFGSGFNTPGVIRYPLEQITFHHPDAKMIRFNRDFAHFPKELQGKSISIEGEIAFSISQLVNLIGDDWSINAKRKRE